MASYAADIIIPSCKEPREVAGLVAEIRAASVGSPRVYATCRPICAAANRNLGLEWAETELVLMLDDDVTLFQHGWNADLCAAMLAAPNAVMVSASLLQPDGGLGQMLGDPDRSRGGLVEVPRRELPTACICLWNDGTRFDEGYVGSGFEDTDFCARLRGLDPDGRFYVACDVQVVHRNERKAQGGANWRLNKRRYQQIWGDPQGVYL